MDEVYKKLNDDTEAAEIEDASEIQEFFAGQTIFLTGSTGFVGRVLVEKLLRSCTSLKKIYFLVRSKKEASAVRMNSYFNDKIFDRLKSEVPNCHEKVAFVDGNLLKENLGLSEKDRATIINETTLIYHNASNVKFDERISAIIRSNVYGTKYMLDLAKECKKLRAFMYVSTAYTHSYMQHIDDKFYPPPVEMNVVNDILTTDEAHPHGMEEKALQTFRSKWANNYSFTKSIAESLVEQCGKQVTFACGVYRPSIIISSYMEPIRGWCNNINGPVGAIVGTGVGFIHASPHGLYPIDMTPVDMCVNALITATWDVVVNKDLEQEAKVYNYGSSVEKPVSMQRFTEYIIDRADDVPTSKMMGDYYILFIRNIFLYWVLHVFLHLVPCLLADAYFLAKGEKPKACKLWLVLTNNLRWLFFYVNGNWRIHVPNMRKVWDRLNKKDSELFFSDLRRFDWQLYSYSYWAGLRVYILNDPMSTVEKVRLAMDSILMEANLSGFVIGTILGWPTPVIPLLQDKNMNMTDNQVGWIISILGLGATFGPITTWLTLDRFGRKSTLILSILPMVASYILMGLRTDYSSLLLGRCLAGIGVGIFMSSAPLYIGEVAENKFRGAMGVFAIINMNMGCLLMYIVGADLTLKRLNMMCAYIAIGIAFLLIFIPESPYYYLLQGDAGKARKALIWLRQSDDVKVEFTTMKMYVEMRTQETPSTFDLVMTAGTRRAMTIITLIQLTQLFSGELAIPAYAYDIIEDIKYEISPYALIIVVGVLTLIASFVSVFCVDILGRRPILLFSAAVMFLSLLALGTFYVLRDHNYNVSGVMWIPFLSIMAYAASHAWGFSSLPAILLSEYFPTTVKAKAAMFFTILLSLASGLSLKLFQMSCDGFGLGPTFFICCGFLLTGTIVLVFIMPETKGCSLQAIENIHNGECQSTL